MTHCQFFKKQIQGGPSCKQKKLRTQSRGLSRVGHAWALTKWARWVGFPSFFSIFLKNINDYFNSFIFNVFNLYLN
jgi:hypothetical protein